MRYDVVIVGAGPSGSTAAYVLCKMGLSVVLVDKSTFPRKKLCGGLLTYKTICLLERVLDEQLSSLKQQNIIQCESDSYQLWYKNSLILEHSLDIPVWFTDRYVYDAFLVDKAKDSGAQLLLGERVTKCDWQNGVITTSGGTNISSRFVVGADGVNSIVRRHFPTYHLFKSKWKYNLATGVEISLDKSQCPIKRSFPIIYLGFVNCGYSWIFPGKNDLLVGMGGLIRANQSDFLHMFRSFLESLDIQLASNCRITGHPVPYGNFVRRPVCDNIVLAGDAGGFVDPILGEGIFYAQQTGALAALSISRAIRQNASLENTYMQFLEKYVNPFLERNLRRRRYLFRLLRILGPRFIKLAASNRLERRLVQRMHGISTSESKMEWYDEQNII